MFYFSYNDFMDCTENGKIEGIKRVEEKIARYELKSGMIRGQKYQDLVVELLKEKNELNKFLKGLFKFKEINNIEDIVYFSNIKSIDDNEIVCKIKEKEIFVFIRVIENLDNNITFKIFEKSINIIKRWKNENQKSNKRYPIVIPIVLYIGKNKWKQRKVNNKLKYIICEKNKINFSYNIIDINDLKIENLEKLESKVIKEIIKIKKAN